MDCHFWGRVPIENERVMKEDTLSVVCSRLGFSSRFDSLLLSSFSSPILVSVDSEGNPCRFDGSLIFSSPIWIFIDLNANPLSRSNFGGLGSDGEILRNKLIDNLYWREIVGGRSSISLILCT